MSNLYVSLNRSLENSFNKFDDTNPNSVINRNNIIHFNVNDTFLNFPEQTRRDVNIHDQIESEFNQHNITSEPKEVLSDHFNEISKYSYVDFVYGNNHKIKETFINQLNHPNTKSNNISTSQLVTQSTNISTTQPITQVDSNQVTQPDIKSTNTFGLNEINELKNKISEIKDKLDTIPNVNSPQIIDVDCDKKISIVKNELLEKIDGINDKNKNTKLNYINHLFDLLKNNEIISSNEIINIRTKLSNKEIDEDTIISYLENKKRLSKQFYFDKATNYKYENLFDGKWQVPAQRPPVCISNDLNSIGQYDKFESPFAPFK